MEDWGRHHIGISKNQPHVNADVGYVQVGGVRGLGNTSARSGTSRNHWCAQSFNNVLFTISTFLTYPTKGR
jgi:hypothetical protein